MIAPLIIYPIAHYGFGLQSPLTLYPTVIGTTIIWIVTTYVTKPADEKLLAGFYKKIHPGGIGWRNFKQKYPDIVPDSGYAKLFVNWISGVVVIYAFLFATGRIILQEYFSGLISLCVGILASLIIYFNIKKQYKFDND